MLLIHDTLKNVHFTTVRALGEQNRPRGGSTRVALFLSLAACHVHDVASVASSTGTTGTTAGDSTSASLTSTSTSAVDSTGVED